MRHFRPFLPFLLIALATLAAYWNARTDALVLDDKMFAGQARYRDLSRLPEFFGEAVWTGAGDASDTLYRPLLLASFAIDATLLADRPDLWHLENVLLHVAATLLVYLFLLQLLRLSGPGDDQGDAGKSAILAAALAAVIFGVHPVQAEVVNSIFNRSALFVAIGFTAGLWWLLRHLEARPLLAWAGIWLVYWPVLFSRETGIVLPALAVALVWIHSNGGWRQKVVRCLPAASMAVPLLVYLALRARAIAPPAPLEGAGAGDALGLTDLVIARGLPDWNTVLRLAGVWLDALRLFLWPHPLLVRHSLPDPAWWLIGLFVQLGLIAAALYLYRRRRPWLIAGLALFYLALLPTSRLFGSDGTLMHLYERYLYEPSIGLVALLAFGLAYLQRRGDRLLAAAPALLAVCLLTPLTWARNADWTSDVRLLEHDYRHGVRDEQPLQALTAGLVAEGNLLRAVEVCRENDSGPHNSGYLSVNCATAYALTGDPQRAERAYLDATLDPASRARAFANLSYMLLVQGRLDEIAGYLERAIAAEPDPATRAYLSGLLRIRVTPNDPGRLAEARTLFEEALRLQPGFVLATQGLQEIDRHFERLR